MNTATRHRTLRNPLARLTAAGLCVTCILSLGGCVGQLIGGMAQAAERTGSKTVEAKSDQLIGRSFAVVIVADRATAAEHPTLVGVLTSRITERLAENAMASGYVPPEQVLAYLGNNPSWRAWPRGRLPEELGVDRVVLIDLIEFRMHEPGNQYLWDGLTWGSVEIYDAEAFDPDRPVFEDEIRVRFPDTTGAGPGELQRELVASELLRRFVDRSSWLFYEHKEPNIIPY